MERALQDVPVLDFGHLLQRPFATQLLDDMGADIVKVGRTGAGDMFREMARGMSDVANMHRYYVVCVPRHPSRSLVQSVEVVSSSRGVLSGESRIAAGYRPGNVWLVTKPCVFRYDEAHSRLVVVEIMPGATRDEIIEHTGFKVLFNPACRPVEPVSENELFVLRRQVDPLGIRRLKFIGAKERSTLHDEILKRPREGLRYRWSRRLTSSRETYVTPLSPTLSIGFRRKRTLPRSTPEVSVTNAQRTSALPKDRRWGGVVSLKLGSLSYRQVSGDWDLASALTSSAVLLTHPTGCFAAMRREPGRSDYGWIRQQGEITSDRSLVHKPASGAL
ncbi:MAG: hypothetical protein GY798_26610 [Hyphomicrobiales bacterium]|nr:hypothetical protein [Hyphomicrobiales bacterium]